MSRVASDDHREPCSSCTEPTSSVCQRHTDVPLCEECECVWIVERKRYGHVVIAPGTPWLRWYMGHWPRHRLPPPRVKRYARSIGDVTAILDMVLETATQQFSVIWDRDDALLAIAERAMTIHERDAIAIDGWNEYVQRENAKRKRRRLRGWRNHYYSDTIKPFPGKRLPPPR